MQLRRALERGLLLGDEGVVGEVPRAWNGNDHHQNRKVRESYLNFILN